LRISSFDPVARRERGLACDRYEREDTS